MMIVDLIDEVDFIEKLKNMGAPVVQDMSMIDVQAVLNSWLQSHPEQRSFVMALFAEMTKDNVTVFPEVSKVIDVITRTFMHA